MKKEKKIFQWPNHYSYFVYFALKSEERFVLPCRTTKTFVQVFSKYFFCIYCASMNKCGVDFRCKYTHFFPTHLTAVTCNSLIMPNIKDNVLSTDICLPFFLIKNIYIIYEIPIKGHSVEPCFCHWIKKISNSDFLYHDWLFVSVPFFLTEMWYKLAILRGKKVITVCD